MFVGEAWLHMNEHVHDVKMTDLIVHHHSQPHGSVLMENAPCTTNIARYLHKANIIVFAIAPVSTELAYLAMLFILQLMYTASSSMRQLKNN